MPDRDDLLRRLSRFEKQFFPRYEKTFRKLVEDGQQPKTLFIGCSDSRIVPYALMDCGPGELFIAPQRRQPGAAVDMSAEVPRHGGGDRVRRVALAGANIIVCGHSHCGAIRGLYGGSARHGDAPAPVAATRARRCSCPFARPGALRRVEQRSIVLQMERLMSYPMVAERVREGRLFLHGWYYVIEDGQVQVLDASVGDSSRWTVRRRRPLSRRPRSTSDTGIGSDRRPDRPPRRPNGCGILPSDRSGIRPPRCLPNPPSADAFIASLPLFRELSEEQRARIARRHAPAARRARRDPVSTAVIRLPVPTSSATGG